MVITNSHFTPAAKELSKKSGSVLIDGEMLATWVLEFQAKK
jgi:restriction endonuclease Mrr